MPRCTVLLVALLATVIAIGAARAAAAEQAARPRICLVLSGGGARGASHVGVLKILEQLRVPVDCVVGTSMGAIVGAAYASGATVPELEAVLAAMSTRMLFKELPPREEQSIHLKLDDATNLSRLELGLGIDGLRLPKGLVSGVQLEGVLRALSKARGFQRFDDLPIPFRAVATDLVTGKPVVLSQGELASAMRASMSVPGVIEPVRLEGRLLVDGGLTNNLPVDVARAMGAEVVIAVNLGTPLLRADALKSILGVTAQMMNILTEQNVQASLASLRPTDILVVPHLDDYSATDFDHMATTVPIGEAAARAVADLLARYSVPRDAYASWDARRLAGAATASVTVDEIRFGNLQRVNPQVARSVLQTRPGEPIDQQVLDRDMQRLFGTGDFEHVSYSLLEEPGRRILSIDAAEKSWGPNYLRFGLGLSTDFRGDSFFNLLTSYRMTWLNRLGGEWRTDVQLGRTSRLATQFYQPLQPGPGFFVAPYAEYERRTDDVFQGDQRVASFDTDSTRLGAAVGAQLTRYGEVRLGLERGSVRSTLDTGPPVFEPDRAKLETTSATLRAVVDQVDNLNFPRSGYGATLAVTAARQGLGSDVNFTRAETAGSIAYSLGEHTFQFGWKLGRRFGSEALPASQMFKWGGFLQQSGYPTGALIGEDLRYARLVYYKRLARWQLLDGVYAGGSLEIGRMDQPLIPNNETGTLRSAALLLGVDTPLGPFYLGYGRTSHGHKSLYMFLGRP
jgi:NTE family protein